MRLNFVSTTRSDFSILLPLIDVIDSSAYSYRLLVFGEKHSTTVQKEVEKHNLNGEICKFAFNEKPQNLDQLIEGMRDLYGAFLGFDLHEISDCLIVLGDRYELMPIVTKCFMNNIKVLHLCGGDRTLGSKDDNIRDVISKLSYLHFVTNAKSKQNLLNFGIDERFVENVGHLPLQDLIPRHFDANIVAKELGIIAKKHNILVTLHPDTTKPLKFNMELVDNTINALSALQESKFSILFTGSNADEGALQMEELINKRIATLDNFFFIQNLGGQNFKKVLGAFDIFAGNSSSIFYEAPEFRIVSICVGDRQHGRIMNNSILKTDNSRDSIYKNVLQGLNMYPLSVKNPYKDSNCITRILTKLKLEGILND